MKTFLDRDWAASMASKPGINSGLRLVFLAISRSDTAGRAKFERGELAECLPTINQKGETVAMGQPNLHRAIQSAVASGLLDRGSSSRELIIPMEVR